MNLNFHETSSILYWASDTQVFVLTEEIHKIVFFTLTQPFPFSISLSRFYLYVQIPDLGSLIPNNFTPFLKNN